MLNWIKTFDVDETIIKMMWAYLFNRDQGYHPGITILHQDSRSTIQLGMNSWQSSSHCTRHLNFKYFYLRPSWPGMGDSKRCPIEKIVADCTTKPLQCIQFKHLWAIVMNCLIDILISHPSAKLRQTSERSQDCVWQMTATRQMTSRPH